MPNTSADKVRQAQAARRRAAQNSRTNRGAKAPASAPVMTPVSSPAAAPEPAPVEVQAPVATPQSTLTSQPSGGANMPMSSAEKIRKAQDARRRAAQRSAADRLKRAQQKADAAAQAAVAVQAAPVQQQIADAVASVADSSGSVSEADIDALCEIVESDPGVLGPDTNSVRYLCRNRRRALSNKGKAAIPGKSSTTGRVSRPADVYISADTSTRDVARRRRESMALRGRGSEPASRPSGRIRPKHVPPKVEVGTTLSGEPVTGTQVERTTSVTGNESGTCRAVTGTEYVGSEQFETFCGVKPEPNPAKVGASITGGGMSVSGTEVGRSAGVTGDESGSCRTITGSEYVGAERFSEFCENKGFNKQPAKVVESRTEHKNLVVTGSDEARSNATTGTEAGASRGITGSQYADTGSAKLTINGPSKVALTHTIAGRPVTGTEVGRSSSVTGDESGSCRNITGTEYLSNEQFASICQTAPAVSTPEKVGVDTTREGQFITGNLVDRTEKVTGNEPGSCKHVTGSQYGESKLCGGAPSKAPTLHTLSGGELTGTQVDHSPKQSGDVQGGCLPVTGTEYYGQEEFSGHCECTPQPKPAKVGIEHTPKGQHVSGTMVNNTNLVTGNEMGADLPVSGTPYGGIKVPKDHGACCDACAAQDIAEAQGLTAPQVPACQSAPAEQPRFPVEPAPAAPQVQPEPQDFSIVSPARAAAQSRVTGSAYGGGRVTGPNNMAPRLISGTPEFRYQGQAQPTTMVAPSQYQQQYAVAPAPVVQQAPEPVMQQPAPAPVQQPQVTVQEMPMAAPVQQQQQVVYQEAPVQQPQVVYQEAPVQQPQVVYQEAPVQQPQVAPQEMPAPVVQQQPVQQQPAVQMQQMPVEPVQQQQVVMQSAPAVAASQQAVVTGEGKENGIGITGDNWARGQQITGTEGRSAQGRNPTLRGEAYGEMPSGAHGNIGMERPEVPLAKVTGSSGNADTGALITVSGGARG